MGLSFLFDGPISNQGQGVVRKKSLVFPTTIPMDDPDWPKTRENFNGLDREKYRISLCSGKNYQVMLSPIIQDYCLYSLKLSNNNIRINI